MEEKKINSFVSAKEWLMKNRKHYSSDLRKSVEAYEALNNAAPILLDKKNIPEDSISNFISSLESSNAKCKKSGFQFTQWLSPHPLTQFLEKAVKNNPIFETYMNHSRPTIKNY